MRALRGVCGAYRATDAVLAALGRLFSRTGAETDPGRRNDSSGAEPDAAVGPILAREDAPKLFAMLGELAARIEGGHPTEVRVSYLPDCGIIDLETDSGGCRQVLVIGLPCFEIWSPVELRSVLAHELAHLKQEDAVFTREVLDFSDRLRRSVRTGSLLSPRRLLTRGVGIGLALLATPVSRAMEHRADSWSAERFGAAPLASALKKLAIVQPIFREVLTAYDASDAEAPNVYQYFSRFWGSLSKRDLQRLRRRLVDHRVPGYLDRHPALTDRLERLSRIAVEAGVSSRKSKTLLANPVELQWLLHNRLYGLRSAPASVFEPIR